MKYSAKQIAERLDLPEPTDEQCAIIEADLTPGITIAGAGSGKTTVVSQRVLYLVANGLVEPQQIIGLTFTNKAAGEMSDKISSHFATFRKKEGITSPSTEMPTIQTYNSFASGLVSEYGATIGVEPDTQVLDDASAIELADQIVATAHPDFIPAGKSRSSLVKELIQLAGQANEHLRTPEDIITYLDTCLYAFLNREFIDDCIAAIKRKKSISPQEKEDHISLLQELTAPYLDTPGKLWPADIAEQVFTHLESLEICTQIADVRNKKRLAHLLDTFASVKNQNRAMQFSDQVSFAYQAMMADPNIVESERAKWKVVFLDEYQDTSDSQVKMLKTLFAGLPITAVGDPRQSIYAWRGASELNIEGFPHDFVSPGQRAASFTMTTSFRNSQRVLAIANAIAGRLPEDSEDTRLKPITTNNEVTSPLGDVEVSVTQGKTHPTYVSDQLESLVEWMRGRTGHRAVLVRKRMHFAPVAQALTAAGFDVQVVGDAGGMGDPFVADTVAILNVATDPHAVEHLMRLLTGRVCSLGAHDLRAFNTIVKNANAEASATPLTAVECVDSFATREYSELSLQANERLRSLAFKLREVRKNHGGAIHMIRTIMRVFDMSYELASLPHERAESHRANIDTFVSAVSSYVARNPTVSMTAVLAWLELANEHDAISPPPESLDESAVTIMTVHASKGLEFDAVALPFLTMGDLPTQPRSYQAWLTLGELPYPLRGDATKLPHLDLAQEPHVSVSEMKNMFKQSQADKEDIEDFIDAESIDEKQLPIRDQIALYHRRQERRLAYVAVTRAKAHLWLGASYWGHRTTANQLSPFLLEAIGTLNVAGANIEIPECEPDKPEGLPVEVQWPPVISEAEQKKQSRTRDFVRSQAPLDLDSPVSIGDEGFHRVFARVQKIMSDARPQPPRVPQRMSTTDLVKYRANADAYMREVQRPMPQQPSEYAALGTAFHAWVEQHFGQSALTDIHEAQMRKALPAHVRKRFDSLVATFERSAYANRVPHAVELPFELELGGRKVPGKIDAVFKDGDRVTVVDWKTGRKPSADILDTMATQLAIYVHAVQKLPEYADCEVGAEFYFVGSDETFTPDTLPSLDIAGILDAAP